MNTQVKQEVWTSMASDQSDDFFPVVCVKWKLGQLKKYICGYLGKPTQKQVQTLLITGWSQRDASSWQYLITISFNLIIHLWVRITTNDLNCPQTLFFLNAALKSDK